MQNLLPLLPENHAQKQTALLARNKTTAHFGLALTPEQALVLVQQQAEVLRGTHRIEFGEGILPRLAEAFCDSPYLAPHNYADTLAELCELFYHFKNESMDRIGDEDLLQFMRRCFDEPCHGSLEYLSGTLLEALARGARFGFTDEVLFGDAAADGESEDTTEDETGEDAYE